MIGLRNEGKVDLLRSAESTRRSRSRVKRAIARGMIGGFGFFWVGLVNGFKVLDSAGFSLFQDAPAANCILFMIAGNCATLGFFLGAFARDHKVGPLVSRTILGLMIGGLAGLILGFPFTFQHLHGYRERSSVAAYLALLLGAVVGVVIGFCTGLDAPTDPEELPVEDEIS